MPRIPVMESPVQIDYVRRDGEWWFWQVQCWNTLVMGGAARTEKGARRRAEKAAGAECLSQLDARQAGRLEAY